MHFLKKHYYKIAVVGIFLLTIFLRFYSYDSRWGLAYDQAHDAIMAHYAVENFKLPLLGPFSSAGPFQTGGEWYWIVMLGTALYPPAVITPWIFMTSLYVIFVGLLMVVANKIAGKQFALIAGVLAAVSTAQIAQGTNLTNQSPQAIIGLLSILCAVLYVKKQALRYLFFLGFSIGFASSIHLSGVALMLLAFSLFVVMAVPLSLSFRRRPESKNAKRKDAKIDSRSAVSPVKQAASFVRRNDKIVFLFKGVVLLVFGAVIPWIPVFIVDVQNNFFNTKNMLQFYLHDQHKIPLEAFGRRWLTYLGVFWPKEWAHMIGGFPFMGYLEMALAFVILFMRNALKKEIVMILLSIFLTIILLRYTHAPLFSSYLVFTHSFVLLVTAWVVYVLIQKNKIIGTLLLVCIVGFSFYRSISQIKTSSNSSNVQAKEQVSALKKKYGDKKFAVYTYGEKWKDKDYILALYLERENLLDPNGLRIGTVVASDEAEFKGPTIWGEKTGFQVRNIHGSSSAQLKNLGWRLVSGETTYRETEEWYK